MLKLNLDEEKRVAVTRLLAIARKDLARALAPKTPRATSQDRRVWPSGSGASIAPSHCARVRGRRPPCRTANSPNIFAGGHRHGTDHQSRNAGDQDARGSPSLAPQVFRRSSQRDILLQLNAEGARNEYNSHCHPDHHSAGRRRRILRIQPIWRRRARRSPWPGLDRPGGALVPGVLGRRSRLKPDRWLIKRRLRRASSSSQTRQRKRHGEIVIGENRIAGSPKPSTSSEKPSRPGPMSVFAPKYHSANVAYDDAVMDHSFTGTSFFLFAMGRRRHTAVLSRDRGKSSARAAGEDQQRSP